jgi:hypothetical protein
MISQQPWNGEGVWEGVRTHATASCRPGQAGRALESGEDESPVLDMPFHSYLPSTPLYALGPSGPGGYPTAPAPAHRRLYPVYWPV